MTVKSSDTLRKGVELNLKGKGSGHRFPLLVHQLGLTAEVATGVQQGTREFLLGFLAHSVRRLRVFEVTAETD